MQSGIMVDERGGQVEVVAEGVPTEDVLRWRLQQNEREQAPQRKRGDQRERNALPRGIHHKLVLNCTWNVRGASMESGRSEYTSLLTLFTMQATRTLVFKLTPARRSSKVVPL